MNRRATGASVVYPMLICRFRVPCLASCIVNRDVREIASTVPK